MKKYWFYLENSVYVETKPHQTLLYNTQNGTCIKTVDTESVRLIQEVCNLDNLGCILVDETDLTEPVMQCIKEIKSKHMGNLLEVTNKVEKPIFLRPVLNLNKDIDKLGGQPESELYLKKDISKYLLNLNVYLNGNCTQHCQNCHLYAHQFNCCIRQKDANTELPQMLLESILNQIQYFPIQTINFLGGNIYQYAHLNSLEQMQSGKKYHFYVHYKNYQKNHFVDSQDIELMTPFPLDEEAFYSTCEQINMDRLKVHFIVSSEDEVDKAQQYVQSLNLSNYELHPFFNMHNQSFFEDNVFYDEKDLHERVITMREIFRNQKLNANCFGNLYILPDGNVKVNMNSKTLANIETMSIIDILYKELTENTGWRKIRNSFPCNECIYQYLCPPISNYEDVLKRYNLCHIRM